MHLPEAKISFCTICRNDTDLLKRTLRSNIKHNENYSNLEFIILDCNTTTQLEVWINKNYAEYINTGKLVYHKLTEPAFFNFSAAKNTILRSANGDILCLIHPGHYTGSYFAAYINEAFHLYNNMVLITAPVAFHEPTCDHPPGLMIGKLCVTRGNFIAVNGFDELMIKFGNEDIDIVNRLQSHGVTRNYITNTEYCKFIKQQTGRGFLLYKSTSIDSIFICPLTPTSSEIIFLYKNRSFEKGTLIDQAALFADDYKYSFQQRDDPYRYHLKGIEKRGSWINDMNEHCIRFQYSEHETFELKAEARSRYDRLIHESTGELFRMVNDPWMVEKLVILNNVFYNTKIMEEKAYRKMVKANTEKPTTPLTAL